ncbi:hypothetical protein AB0E08_41440 [Streptomyces sp. NPDC048281]|uniref:hypothetical protein n=1 Tax=Streptomyces sp. NPDC048281 TaxID=3154715 RepID=UPI00343B813A
MAEQTGESPEGKPSAKRGRKFGPLYARSQEYADLADFLRECMTDAGLTLAALKGPTQLRTSAISERLSGLKIDEDFVKAVVVACTEEDGRREQLLRHGEELLRIAMSRNTQVVDLTREPRPIRNVVVAAMDSAVQAQLKLVDLHEQLARKNDELATLAAIRFQSQQAMHASDALSTVLSTWVVVLADEVERLGRERESAMTAQPPDLGRLSCLDTELARTVAQHSRTAAELARTQQDRTLATALLAEALTRTRRARDEVRSLRAAAQLPAGGGGLATEPSASVSDGIAFPSAFGDDIDAVLDRAEAVGRGIADRLHSALAALDEGARTEPSSVPPSATNNTDNTDNAVAGEDPTDNALWWDLLADVPTDAFVWAEETAVGLVRDRDPLDPGFGRIAREHSAREVLLLADRLQEHRWLEGAARTRFALALALGPEELLPLIDALIGSGPLLNRAEQGAQLLRVALAGRTAEDALNLQYRLDRGAGTSPVVRDAIAAIAQRPYAEMVALVRRQLTDNPRLLTHGLLIETIVRKWPPAEVIDLVRETMGIEDAYVVGHVFFALPTPPADQTELLIRLWDTMPAHWWFDEALSSLYPAGAGSDDLARIIQDLHADWPAPLDRAARELAAQIMPLIIVRTPLGTLSAISDLLIQAGLSPESVFEPYRRLFLPDFARDHADRGPEA